jgi:L-serine dehydratase
VESISVFDIIKVGIGPSSSHTMGPWEASLAFVAYMKSMGKIETVKNFEVNLYGSLAKTGKGHGTDFAIVLGLAGLDYKVEDTDALGIIYQQILETKKIKFGGGTEIDFLYENIHFEGHIALDFHPNGMKLTAILEDDTRIEKTYFSVGGGFVIEETAKDAQSRLPSKNPCHNGETILAHCEKMNKTVSELVLDNELSWMTEAEIEAKALKLWDEMRDAIWRGCKKEGILPGYLKVKRRAYDIFEKLTENQSFETANEWIEWLQTQDKDFNKVNKWISCFALAVNEENASYGRIVTAPTNGAAGVLPAVLMYAVCFLPKITEKEIVKFILVAGEIGTLFKKSATISAAMGGCQAEIGVSSAMAAAGLTEISGGSPEQVLMAAEIAMEHHLGMTCDPVGGLVQIPCIERNSMGAIKAITASNIALESNPKDAKVSLDSVIKTMWQTALDMNTKYKETSEAGLATNISVNIAEC